MLYISWTNFVVKYIIILSVLPNRICFIPAGSTAIQSTNNRI